MLGLNLKKYIMSNFHALEFVCRGSETQLQVGESVKHGAASPHMSHMQRMVYATTHLTCLTIRFTDVAREIFNNLLWSFFIKTNTLVSSYTASYHGYCCLYAPASSVAESDGGDTPLFGS